MPRKVTAFACQWRCGYKVQTKKSRMVGHEDRCCHNPKNRACVTCGNFYPTNDAYDLFLGCSSIDDDLDDLRKHCPAWIPVGQEKGGMETDGDRQLRNLLYEEESLKWVPQQEDPIGDCF